MPSGQVHFQYVFVYAITGGHYFRFATAPKQVQLRKKERQRNERNAVKKEIRRRGKRQQIEIEIVP